MILIGAIAVTAMGEAAWYWPFGSDDDAVDAPRLSQLMEPATELIDEASDLAAEGKVTESVEKYRQALQTLDRIEAENPGRAQSQEFATVRNKRAYVNAAIDSLLLNQVKQNAKPVAVSDTTELEKRLADERAEKAGRKPKPPAEEKAKVPETVSEKASPKVSAEKPKPAVAKGKKAKPTVQQAAAAAGKSAEVRPTGGKDLVAYCIAHGEFTAAAEEIKKMLVQRPNDPGALNLRAALESAQDRPKDAEATLDQAIMSNPRNHYAYYNMALLILRTHPENHAAAKRYYETGRAVGGPEDPELEELLK